MITQEWNLNVDKNTNNLCGIHKYNIENVILCVNLQ